MTTTGALWILAGVLCISGGVAAVVQIAKSLLDAADLGTGPWRRAGLRALGVVLGMAAVLALDVVPWPVALAAGAMAGAASEVVYRWIVRDLLGLLQAAIARRM